MEETTSGIKAKLTEFVQTLTRDNLDEKIDEIENFIIQAFDIPEIYHEMVNVAIIHDHDTAQISLSVGLHNFTSDTVTFKEEQHESRNISKTENADSLPEA